MPHLQPPTFLTPAAPTPPPFPTPPVAAADTPPLSEPSDARLVSSTLANFGAMVAAMLEESSEEESGLGLGICNPAEVSGSTWQIYCRGELRYGTLYDTIGRMAVKIEEAGEALGVGWVSQNRPSRSTLAASTTKDDTEARAGLGFSLE